MHPSRTAAPAAAFWLALLVSLAPSTTTRATSFPTGLPSSAEPDEGALERARRQLAQGDAAGAASLLEGLLATVESRHRPALIDLLRQSYEAAATAAESAGKADVAEAYRDNLAILARKPARTTTLPTTTATPPGAVDRAGPVRPLPTEVQEPTQAQADPAVVPASPDPAPPPATATATAAGSAERLIPLPRSAGSAPPLEAPKADRPPPAGAIVAGPPAEPVAAAPATIVPPVEAPGPGRGAPAAAVAPATTPGGAATPAVDEVSVAAADAAFVAKRYDEAGASYAELDRTGALPPARRDHWAYCRAVAVVRRINAHPSSEREWAAIEAEIEQVRRLSPSNWFAEYLRNRAAERNPAVRASRRSDAGKVVVRGSSPDEPGAPAVPPAATGGVVPSAPAAPPALPPVDAAPVRWVPRPVFTPNFQVMYTDGQRALAESIGKAAEEARASLVKRWGETTPGLPWSPRCEVLLFPTAADYCRATGQPAESPGISTMRMAEGRVDGRRINLRADHPNAVKAVLPHEVTHVVLADLFPLQQVPRWADEGMAVLSEPTAEQDVRAADLDEPLAAGQLFRLDDLVAMDYPDPRFLSLYYAQSVSLTRFLVEQGSPAQFIDFLRQSQWVGLEPALKKVYEIAGVGELQTRWLAFARARSAALVAANAGAGAAASPDGPRARR